jgi:hypothetical protein
MRHLLIPFLLISTLPAQIAARLDAVHRVYLSFPRNKPALAKVATDLAHALEKSGAVTVVESPADADAVLAADGDVYIKGYFSLNPRAGTSPANGQAVRGGFLSVELKGLRNETLWSYLATPKFGSTRIEQELSRQVTRELVAALREKKASKP